jgi:hypothetical protein
LVSPNSVVCVVAELDVVVVVDLPSLLEVTVVAVVDVLVVVLASHFRRMRIAALQLGT